MEVETSGESMAAGAELRTTRRPWGTWEELVLGGAVLRHGTADWDPVAAELRVRFPYPFTPQECEAKYEAVRQRFSGFDAWFEELRRQRVEQLRRELEKSEDSIGSLQLRLETLKAERESDQSTDYNSGHRESPFPTGNAEGTDLSGKEPSNDRSSAGSFIEESRSVWSPEPQIADSISAQDVNVEDSRDSTWNTLITSGDAVVVPGNLRKKRGARRRRFQNDAKEGSIGLSNSACSVDINREESKGLSPQTTGPSKQGPSSEDSGRHSIDHRQDLGGILDAIMKHEGVSLFGCRLESQFLFSISRCETFQLPLNSHATQFHKWHVLMLFSPCFQQKKARYRKMIRRHVDFQIIRSRISDGSISSIKEVLRDLLLLSNNVVVFYPKHSREHRSALILRELVTKGFRGGRGLIESSNVGAPLGDVKMAKPEASGAHERKNTGSQPKPGRATATTKKTGNSRRASGGGIAPTPPPKKRGVGRPAKNRSQEGPKESPVKGRKVRR